MQSIVKNLELLEIELWPFFCAINISVSAFLFCGYFRRVATFVESAQSDVGVFLFLSELLSDLCLRTYVSGPLKDSLNIQFRRVSCLAVHIFLGV